MSSLFTNIRIKRICSKLAYFLGNLQTSRANNSIILRIKSAKFSGHCFYMNTNINRDFQVCINVPLLSNSITPAKKIRPILFLKESPRGVL